MESGSAGGGQHRGCTGQGAGNWGAAGTDPVLGASGLHSVLWDTPETRESNSGIEEF